MATLTKISRTNLAPGSAVSSANLLKWVPENFDALRLLTYGTRTVAGAAPGHDHGEHGGELIAGRPILSLQLGPTFNVNGSGGETTLPREGVYLPAYETGVDTDTERPVVFAPIFLPGGVLGIDVKLVYYAENAAADTVTLKASLRDFSAHGQDFETGSSEVSGSASEAAPSDGYHVLTISLADLSPLGSPDLDRELEICVWQAFSRDTASSSTYRLVHVSVIVDETTGGRVARAADAPLAQVAVADVVEAAPITADLGTRIRIRSNQESQALLGRAPGIAADGKTPDRQRPYTQLIEAEHSHEGSVFPVTTTEFEARGAVLREQLAVSFYSTGGLSGGTVFTQRGLQVNPLGLLVGFPGGTGADTQARFRFRCSISAGLGALYLRFAGLPNTAETKTALMIGVDVNDFGGTSIVHSVSSGLFNPAATQDGDSLYYTEVDPLDSPFYEANEARRRTGLGRWTGSALLPEFTQPIIAYDGTAEEAFNRVSELVRVDLTYPPARPDDDLRTTGDYMVNVKFELRDLTNGGYEDFYLLWLHILPAVGY